MRPLCRPSLLIVSRAHASANQITASVSWGHHVSLAAPIRAGRFREIRAELSRLTRWNGFGCRYGSSLENEGNAEIKSELYLLKGNHPIRPFQTAEFSAEAFQQRVELNGRLSKTSK
ncbi:hypothetical protein RRG08_034921 [Elysia crispata]|uniref:Uncharacterized protein n=1 Tax=Elysia crispata TaxID=231223 RepID=A0AAE1D2J4_9GAST|nr:hypothetical protein RRG08_034921 [Elysia crispata]